MINKPKILTDIRISQCPTWGEQTELLFRTSRRDMKIFRLPLLFRLFIRLLRHCKNYDVVITSNIKLAQLFGLVRTILRWKEPKHIILELMLDEFRDSIFWKIKRFLQRICFSSVDLTFVSSSQEIKTYAQRLNIPESRFRFLPFHTNVLDPHIVPGRGGYIFSAGKTGRDYATLAEAVEGIEVPVVIVSDTLSVQGIKFPPNVEVYCDISYAKYMEILYESSMVVVPLRRRIKSTGQVVLLEAMALGKPVVVTNTIGTEDYIEHGLNGMLVPPMDSHSLRSSIKTLLNDNQLSSQISYHALQAIYKKHTFEVYTAAILDIADQIYNGQQIKYKIE